MNLNKVSIHRNLPKINAVSQITRDEDYNVPDYRPDIVKILREKGTLRFDEVRAGTGACRVKGSLIFKVLYRSDRKIGKICCLRGEIPFQEKINMEGLGEYDKVRVTGEIEDITIGVIHSRKLNIRAVIVLRAEATEEMDEEFTTGIAEEDAEDCEQKTQNYEMLRLVMSERDISRKKSELVLPSSKPNINEILWKSVELRSVESFLKSGTVGINGEVLVSVLYSEEDGERLQWYETTVPLSCSVDSEAAREGSLYHVRVTPVVMELETKQDFDGEERILSLETAMDMEIRIWEEERIDILEDVYSLKKDIVPIRKERSIERLCIKNCAKHRMVEKMELADSQEKILQICSCEGNILLEKREITPEGVLAEGVLTVELLYITTDDGMPVGTVKEIYPFSELLELPENDGGIRMELECGVEQLSAVMLDREHVEIKAVINLDLLAFCESKLMNIEELTEQQTDMERLQQSPGLVGYIAKAGDDLWTIAKENHTTVADIMALNQLKSDTLSLRDKILIMKRV